MPLWAPDEGKSSNSKVDTTQRYDLDGCTTIVNNGTGVGGKLERSERRIACGLERLRLCSRPDQPISRATADFPHKVLGMSPPVGPVGGPARESKNAPGKRKATAAADMPATTIPLTTVTRFQRTSPDASGLSVTRVGESFDTMFAVSWLGNGR